MSNFLNLQLHLMDFSLGFLGHAWGLPEDDYLNHRRVAKIQFELERVSKKTSNSFWFDEKQITGDIKKQIRDGVKRSLTFIVFITRMYEEKINTEDSRNPSYYEYDNAEKIIELDGFIPVIMEAEMLHSWRKGRLFSDLHGRLYVDFSAVFKENSDIVVNEDVFQSKCLELYNLVIRKIFNDHDFQRNLVRELQTASKCELVGGQCLSHLLNIFRMDGAIISGIIQNLKSVIREKNDTSLWQIGLPQTLLMLLRNGRNFQGMLEIITLLIQGTPEKKEKFAFELLFNLVRVCRYSLKDLKAELSLPELKEGFENVKQQFSLPEFLAHDDIKTLYELGITGAPNSNSFAARALTHFTTIIHPQLHPTGEAKKSVEGNNVVVIGSTDKGHYQLYSTVFKPGRNYIVCGSVFVKNDTPVGIGILRTDPNLWARFPCLSTFKKVSGWQHYIIEMTNNLETEATLIFTNQAQLKGGIVNFQVSPVTVYSFE